MEDLISKEYILGKAVKIPGYFSKMVSTWDIVNTSAIDGVEVVRCKDCKYYKSYNEKSGICTLHSAVPDIFSDGYELHMAYNDFCSYGEMKDNV